jgi:hypothetical protein
MSNARETFLELDGIEVLAPNDDEVYRYIPAARPETGPNGQPTVMLMKNALGGILQLGAQLSADEAVLTKIRAKLENKPDVTRPVRLEPAPLQVRAARLMLESPSGAQELQRTQPSALPPSTALFRTSLNTEQTQAVEKVFGGRQGQLRVVYEFDLASQAKAHVRLSGDATQATQTLSQDATETEAREWVEQAVAAGPLRVTEDSSGMEVEPLLKEALQTAKEKAARMVLTFQKRPSNRKTVGDDSVDADVRLAEPRTISLNRATDVADWFTGGQQPVIMAAPTREGAASATVQVRLDFEAKEAPLAFVEIKSGNSLLSVLRGPVWAPVTVNTTGTLSLIVHYTTGAPDFATEVAVTDRELPLTPNQLGLALVVLDASARKAAGAKKLNATVRYLRRGVELGNWPFNFKYGDWTEQWFLVMGGPGLNGSLEYVWQETGPDDTTFVGGPLTTDQTTIQIK